jgi:hypothetical protein
MRVTAIAQGIHNWLKTFHAQVPLSGRESQQLLNALTGSFRDQLDRAHPTKARDEPNPASKKAWNKVLASLETPEPSPKTANGQVHVASAVESADRHLASLLTSPLLMGAPPTAASPRSKRERLAKDHVSKREHVRSRRIKQNEAAEAFLIHEATVSNPPTAESLPNSAQIASEQPTAIAQILREPSLMARSPESVKNKDPRLNVKSSEAKNDQRAHIAADSAPIGRALDEQNPKRKPRRGGSSSKPVQRDQELDQDSLWYHLARPAS